MEITAAVVNEAGKFEFEKVNLDPPKSNEVLIKVVASGICHTDAIALHQIMPMPLPGILGHEGVGIVEAVGDSVTDVKVGDHVIMTYPSCGHCEKCNEHHPYGCSSLMSLLWDGKLGDGTKRAHKEDGSEISSFFGQGSFATHCVAEARNVVVIDKDVDLAAVASFGCAVQTGAGAVFNRMKPEPGSSIAVFGCGAVGMSVIMAAKIAGCSTIIGVDIIPSRLEMALEMGATHVVNGKECDAVAAIKEITNGGVNYSAEATGIPSLITQALNCMGREALCVLISVTGDAEVKIALEPMLMNPSSTLAGLVEGGSDPKVFIPKLIKFYKEGKMPVEKLNTYFDFKDIDKAFEATHNGSCIKSVLVMPE